MTAPVLEVSPGRRMTAGRPPAPADATGDRCTDPRLIAQPAPGPIGLLARSDPLEHQDEHTGARPILTWISTRRRRRD